jgi:hypothetical protein
MPSHGVRLVLGADEKLLCFAMINFFALVRHADCEGCRVQLGAAAALLLSKPSDLTGAK